MRNIDIYKSDLIASYRCSVSKFTLKESAAKAGSRPGDIRLLANLLGSC